MFDHSFFDPVYDRAGTGAIKYNNLTQNTIPMWIADMDFKSPPAITDALIKAAKHGIYGYGDTDDEYDSLIVNWYDRRIGWKIKKEEILKIPGVMFGGGYCYPCGYRTERCRAYMPACVLSFCKNYTCKSP